MRTYSSVLWLMAIITAIVVLQVGWEEVGVSSATISAQSNEMDRPTISGGPLMVPMGTRLAKAEGDAEDEGGDKDKKGDEKDEKHEKDEGGFDRLWDVVMNG